MATNFFSEIFANNGVNESNNSKKDKFSELYALIVDGVKKGLLTSENFIKNLDYNEIKKTPKSELLSLKSKSDYKRSIRRYYQKVGANLTSEKYDKLLLDSANVLKVALLKLEKSENKASENKEKK